ncbi:MAG: peptidylprolyl isomerase [Planctomycetota bacterium]
MAEYEESIRANIGLRKLVEREWTAAYGRLESIEKEIGKQGERIREEYIKVSEIYFTHTEGRKGVPPMKRAKDVWEALKKGGDFHDMARAHSDNKVTGRSGGRKGCVLRLHFLPALRKTLSELGYGEFTAPTPVFGGVVLMKRHPLARKDLEEILRDEFDRKFYLSELRRMEREAVIERK